MEAHSNFRFLIPFQPGDRIALFGADRALEHCLREEKADVVIANREEWKTRTFDHVIIPVLDPVIAPDFPQQFARILRPGGSIFVGFQNRTALELVLFWRRKGQELPVVSFTSQRIKKLMRSHGLSILDSYGIRDLSQPQHLVSLDQHVPSRFFFNHMFYPRSFVAATAQKGAAVASALGFHRAFFRYIGIVARKSGDRVARQAL